MTEPPPDDQPQQVLPVLSYASPRSERRMQKPLRTRIVYEPTADGGAAFTELFDDKGRAIGAILFSLLPLGVYTALTLEALRQVLRHGFGSDDGMFLVCLCIWLVDFGVLLAVVNQMRSRLSISAGKHELLIRRTSAIGTSERRWPCEQVTDIRVLPVAHDRYAAEPLCELQIHPAVGVTEIVFRNYGASELRWVAGTLRKAIGLPVEAGPPIIPATAEAD